MFSTPSFFYVSIFYIQHFTLLTLFTLWFFYVRLLFYVSIFLFIFVLAQSADLSSTINEKGCLLAGEEWLEKNLIVVAGVAVGIAFLQVRTLFFYFFFVHLGIFHFFLSFQVSIIIAISSTTHLLFQILGICFAQNLRADIFAQMAKW